MYFNKVHSEPPFLTKDISERQILKRRHIIVTYPKTKTYQSEDTFLREMIFLKLIETVPTLHAQCFFYDKVI